MSGHRHHHSKKKLRGNTGANSHHIDGDDIDARLAAHEAGLRGDPVEIEPLAEPSPRPSTRPARAPTPSPPLARPPRPAPVPAVRTHIPWVTSNREGLVTADDLWVRRIPLVGFGDLERDLTALVHDSIGEFRDVRQGDEVRISTRLDAVLLSGARLLAAGVPLNRPVPSRQHVEETIQDSLSGLTLHPESAKIRGAHMNWVSTTGHITASYALRSFPLRKQQDASGTALLPGFTIPPTTTPPRFVGVPALEVVGSAVPSLKFEEAAAAIMTSYIPEGGVVTGIGGVEYIDTSLTPIYQAISLGALVLGR